MLYQIDTNIQTYKIVIEYNISIQTITLHVL